MSVSCTFRHKIVPCTGQLVLYVHLLVSSFSLVEFSCHNLFHEYGKYLARNPGSFDRDCFLTLNTASATSMALLSPLFKDVIKGECACAGVEKLKWSHLVWKSSFSRGGIHSQEMIEMKCWDQEIQGFLLHFFYIHEQSDTMEKVWGRVG